MKMVFKTRGDIEMLKKLILIIVIVAVVAGVAFGVNSLLKKQSEPKSNADIVKEIGTPYFMKINMTPEQTKIHDECIKEKDKATKSLFDKRTAVSVEINKINSSALPQTEKDKKIADLNKQMADLNAQSEAIEAKIMAKFENSLNSYQRAEYEKFKADLKKAFQSQK